MKTLTKRTDIATAINFHQYPVIKIDLADTDDYGIKGAKVNIDFGGDYFIHAILRAYNDEKVLTTSQHGSMLSASLSYDDYMEMADYANAPIIKADQDILIYLYNSDLRVVYNPSIIHTGSRVDRFCSTPLTLEKMQVIA